jgi:hypothetical protein
MASELGRASPTRMTPSGCGARHPAVRRLATIGGAGAIGTWGCEMAVLMIGEVPNLTEEIYGSLLEQMKPTMLASQGFIAHSGGPSPSGDGWRVVEMWDSEADAEAWFHTNVEPNLPPDIVPDRRFFPLHSAFAR